MAKYIPLTVSYADQGLEKNKEAFVLADDAFQNLENAYLWRGRIRRRRGFSKLGRLRRILSAFTLDDTSGASVWSFNLKFLGQYVSQVEDGSVTPSIITVNGPHGLSNGDTVTFTSVGGTGELNGVQQTVSNKTDTTFEVATATTTYTSGGFFYANVARADEGDSQINCGTLVITFNGETFTDQGDGTLSGSGAGSGTVNYSTWAITITHAHGAGHAVTVAYEYFPCLPVMGLSLREQDVINVEQTVAYDTKYVYSYASGVTGFRELVSQNPPIYQGTNAQFFTSANYWRDADGTQFYWTTNFNRSDPIHYFNGTRWTAQNGTPAPFEPSLDSGTGLSPEFIYQTKLIIPYKGRLVFLNTWEGVSRDTSVQHPQRARWSQNGDPTDLTNAWRSDIAGRGGFVDCPISEHIVSAEFIRDTLVVAFERSTWLLRYTGNEILPFVWERVNRELGSDSAFSMVPFDRGILYVGDKSINSCDGNNVERIDEKIPDEVFNIHNSNDGPIRVHGFRNFFERLVYWTFPDSSSNGTFPDRLLIFNYENGTWAIWTDSFTTLGTYQLSDDRTWADLAGKPWLTQTIPWYSSKNQADYPSTIAGNQQGFILSLEENTDNEASLFIDSITVGATTTTIGCPNHNMLDGDWVQIGSHSATDDTIENVVGVASNINGGVYQIARVDADSFTIKQRPQTAITAITAVSAAVVTAAGHTLVVGDKVAFRDIAVMTEMNGKTANVIAVSGNDVTVDIDSTLFTTAASGGYIQNLQQDVEALVTTGTYLGCGEIKTLPNFRIRSKKFNLLEKGNKRKLGYIDWLVKTTPKGEFTCRIYTDYSVDDDEESNDYDNSVNMSTDDNFFNTKVLTQAGQFSQSGKKKDIKRFYCPVDSQFFEFLLTLDDQQMSNPSVTNSAVWIDSFIVWSEGGGRLAE